MSDHIEEAAVEPHPPGYVRRAMRPRRSLRERLSATPSAAFLIVSGIAALLVIALLAIGVDAIASAGRIHPGVRMAGIRLGGKQPEQAVAILRKELPAHAQAPVVLVASGKRWTVQPSDLGASFDYEALSQRAMDVGRGDSPVVERLRGWFGGVDVPVIANVDQKQFNHVVRTVEKSVAVAPKDSKVVVEGTDVTVTPSAEGTEVVKPELLKRIGVAIGAEGERTVEVPLAVAKPQITEAGALDAAEAARLMVSAPVSISYKGQSWEFDPENIGGWLTFTAAPAPAGDTSSPKLLQAVVSAEEASAAIAPKVGSLGQPAKDATFHTSGGRVTITGSQNGLQPDLKALSKSLTAALQREGVGRVAPLRMKVLKPELTTQRARGMGIKERISTFTTEFDSGNLPRSNNIEQLARSLDGALVAPGETFSFNGQVGERTAAKGYQEANAIVQGKLVPQLGGGICQVGTTIFNAVFESGFPVVERHNHSFYISHYPKGRDATVSWDGPDFKFKNDSEKWVLVAASTSSGEVTISLYGTDPGYQVTAQPGEFYDVKPYSTEQVKDAKLQKGLKVVEDAGTDGRSVKVKRIVTKNGKVVREDTFVSVYRPKVEVVRVGTKGPAPKAPAKKAPAPKKP